MKKQKIELEFNQYGIKSMIEIAEQLAAAKDKDVHDIDPTYFDILIIIYKKTEETNREILRLMFPIVTKELDQFLL